jgi:predicted metal-binding protein
MNRILVCRTCKQEDQTGVENTLDALTRSLQSAQLDRDFAVGTVDCMGSCEQPVSLAFQGDGRATFVFSGVRFPDDNADIVATARVYLDAEQGWIEDARSCGRLRFCLRARIPAASAGVRG